jgi:hypothetical protein
MHFYHFDHFFIQSIFEICIFLLSSQVQLQYTDHSIYVTTVQSRAMHMPSLLLSSSPRIYSNIFLTIQSDEILQYFLWLSPRTQY